MSTAVELEEWLRSEASERIKRAESRRSYVRAGINLSAEDRQIAHVLAEQMMGRKLPKSSRKQDEINAQTQERIATKLEKESTMILRFADFVRDGSKPE